MPLLLSLFRSLGHRLPRWPKASAVTNRILKPLYVRYDPAPVVVPVLGFEMQLDPGEAVDAMLLFSPQLYDPREVAFVRRHLRRGDTFVDAGANIGFYTLVASQIVGRNGRVIAIEADPDNAVRLRANLQRNGGANVAVVEKGVSDRSEVLTLTQNLRGNRGGSTFAGPGGAGLEVACAPLLEVLLEAGVERIAFMKLDIEGFEQRVLTRFFNEADASLFPDHLLFEYNYPGQDSAALIALISGKGYREVLRTAYNVVLARDLVG